MGRKPPRKTDSTSQNNTSDVTQNNTLDTTYASNLEVNPSPVNPTVTPSDPTVVQVSTPTGVTGSTPPVSGVTLPPTFSYTDPPPTSPPTTIAPSQTVAPPDPSDGAAVGATGGVSNVTDEGEVIGGSTTPMPEIDDGSKVTPDSTNHSQQNETNSTPTDTDQKEPENPTAPENPQAPASEPVFSYEEFLKNKESAFNTIRDETIDFYDKQSQDTLAAIEAQRQASIEEANKQKDMADAASTEQKNATIAEAENQKNLFINMSEEQKNAVYKFAEEQRISDMNYAAQQYQLLVDSINAQRESGMAMAEEQRKLLLDMSEEQRNAIYAAAESQRVAAEQRADVERERGVVDARSSYEQNKASYGAKAEAMGKMGLSGSGYGDYLNSKAYAQQRAETQAANARSDASKREARYAEDQARLQADSDYYQNKYNAEQAYSDRKYQIDTTYQTNMLNAEQGKAQSIYEAESSERETKFNADQADAQNRYAAESDFSKSQFEAESADRESKLQSGLTYSENLFNAESQARADEHSAKQTAEAGKFGANMSYQENILKNEEDRANYNLAKEEKAQSAFTALLSEANNGSYNADQLQRLAEEYGLSADQTEKLLKAASDKAEKTKTERYENYSAEIYYGNADTGAIERAYERGDISEEQYADLINQWNASIDRSDAFFYSSNGELLPKSVAESAMKKIVDHPWMRGTLATELRAIFAKLYP